MQRSEDAQSSPKPTKKQQRREASYLALVDAAMHQFADHGFAATRVEDIARAAGHTSGAFYFHFTNKLDCFWAVIDHREALRGDWVSHVITDLAPEASLRSVLEATFAHFAAVEARYRSVQRTGRDSRCRERSTTWGPLGISPSMAGRGVRVTGRRPI